MYFSTLQQQSGAANNIHALHSQTIDAAKEEATARHSDGFLGDQIRIYYSSDQPPQNGEKRLFLVAWRDIGTNNTWQERPGFICDSCGDFYSQPANHLQMNYDPYEVELCGDCYSR